MAEAAVLAALAAATAVVVGVRRLGALRPVARELRTARLLLLFPVVGPRTLAVARRFLPASRVATGVTPLRCTAHVGDREVPVVIYEVPVRRGPTGAVLWMHGGGLVLGSPEADQALCSRIASEIGILVLSVDYRLAPEHPFPAALDDCYIALQWLHEQATALAVDPARIAVAGASAGGGLAAALCQVAHDMGTPPIAFQLLEYPMLDDRTVLRRDHGGRDRLTWTPASNRYGWTSYLGGEPQASQAPPYAVPARRADLAGLPPTWIGVGDLDMFYDEDIAYAKRLTSAGVPCELVVVPGMYHGADVLVETAPAVTGFLGRMTAALTTALGTLHEPGHVIDESTG